MIVHSGQTGVERGAHQGAVASGLEVTGVCTSTIRDELGPLPPDVATRLRPCSSRGFRPALAASLELATHVLLIVRDADAASPAPAMGWVLTQIRRLRLDYIHCDHQTHPSDVTAWLAQAGEGRHHVLVTGPRATRWPNGEYIARRLIQGLGATT